MAEVIYLNESDNPEVFLQRKNTSTGALEPASGLTTLRVIYAATSHGAAIDPALSIVMTERSASPGTYYALVSGAAKAAHLTVDQAVYIRITDGVAIDEERPVVVRQIRDTIPTTLPSTGETTIVTPPPPPPPPPDETDLTPFAVVVGPSSISIAPGSTQTLTAVIRNAEGGNLDGLTPTSWSAVDTAVATVNSSGVVTGVAAGSTTIVAHYDAITSNSVSVTIRATNVVIDQAGPTTTLASSTVNGITFYEDMFTTYGDAQWLQYGAAWNAGNTISEYERPLTYWVWWVRTGEQKWYDRAVAMLLDWRENYLLPNNADPFTANPSPHFSQAESLYVHWLLTGDTRSRDAALGSANNMGLSWALEHRLAGIANPNLESRVQARALMAMWIATRIAGEDGQPSDQNPTTYGEYLDGMIEDTLSSLNANGYGEFASTCGGSLTYMCCMLADTLARIYDQRPGSYNATILTKLTALGNYLWDTQWRGTANPSDLSFNYISLLCTGTGSPTASPDLNGINAVLFGWLGLRTGDSSWYTKGDQILQGMQQSTGIYLYRQFSEQFTSSYRYLGYRYPEEQI